MRTKGAVSKKRKELNGLKKEINDKPKNMKKANKSSHSKKLKMRKTIVYFAEQQKNSDKSDDDSENQSKFSNSLNSSQKSHSSLCKSETNENYGDDANSSSLWNLIPDNSYRDYLEINDETFPLPTNLPQYAFKDLDPMEIFQLFFTDELLQHFVDASNFQISRFKKNCQSFWNGRCISINNFELSQSFISLNEIKIFLGIRLLFGVNTKPCFLGNIFCLIYFHYQITGVPII